MFVTRSILLSSTLNLFVAAQTSTKCNPLTESCPKDNALGTQFFQTWNSSSPSALDTDYWTVTAGEDLISMTDPGMTLTLNKKGDSVTAQTSFYIFWGEVEVEFEAAKGQGIISTVNLLSDDLDEIDVEIQGSNSTHVSTNYYGQGDQSQQNAIWYPINPSPQSQTHKYKVVWDQHQTQWLFDGQVVRTLPAAAPKQYPQTPSFIKVGVWAAGDSDSPGVVQWAGGPTQWNQAPFAMTVKSISIKDGSNNASSYSYNVHSDGGWQSINVVNGTSDAAKAVAKPPPQTATERWHGLSTRAKVGIAVAVIGALVLGVIGFFFFFIKQRKAGRKMRAVEEDQWARENTELMHYKAGLAGDEFGRNSITVATARKW